MRTNEFINTLVADHAAQSPPKPIAYRLVMALVGGFALSAALLFITLGVRPDIMAALGTWRFDLKLGGSLVLAIAASWVACAYQGLPQDPYRRCRAARTRAPSLRGSRR